MATRKAAANKSTKSAVKKPYRTRAGNPTATPPSRRWSAKVTTDSTHPEHNLFNQDAETIAHHLASKKISPKGPASGMRMLTFYINRAGKNLSASRRRELEKAKKTLHGIIEAAKPSANKSPGMKKTAAKSSGANRSAPKKSTIRTRTSAKKK